MASCVCKAYLCKRAEDPGFVFGAYFAALLPLGAVYALDFITEKWKRIRATRSEGMRYLFLSIISLPYLMYFIHLQRCINNYTEMGAAITAALLCFFHMSRTAWGLIQLEAFKRWNMHALYVLTRIGYESPVYQHDDCTPASSPSTTKCGRFVGILTRKLSSLLKLPIIRNVRRIFVPMKHTNDRTLLSTDELANTIEHHMVVNSSLIDNAFTDTDIPIRLSPLSLLVGLWKSRGNVTKLSLCDHMYSTLPAECSVQWMVAFFSRFGYSWIRDAPTYRTVDRLRDGSPLPVEEIFILATLHVTRLVNRTIEGQEVRTEHISPLPLTHLFLCDPMSSQREAYNVPSASSLPFQLRGIDQNSSLSFNEYKASIQDGIFSWDRKCLHELDGRDREATREIEPYHISCFAKLMDCKTYGGIHFTHDAGTDIDKWNEENEMNEDDMNYVRWEFRDPRVTRFKIQSGCWDDMQLSALFQRLPIRKEVLRKLLWNDDDKDYRFLQVTVHIDNWLSLEAGKRLKRCTDSDSIKNSTGEKEGMSLYESQVFFEKESIIHECDEMEQLIESKSTFFGCVTESARCFLSKWILMRQRDENVEFAWTPSIEDARNKFSLTCSAQLLTGLQWKTGKHCVVDVSTGTDMGSRLSRSIDMRLLWELQSGLHGHVSRALNANEVPGQLPSMPHLMMLCVLGFPALEIDFNGAIVQAEKIRHKCKIIPLCGPQDLFLDLELDLSSGKAELKMAGDEFFDWHRWRDSFIARMKARWEARSVQIPSNDTKDLLLDLSETDVPENSNEEPIWKGWPPFSTNFGQKEISSNGHVSDGYSEEYSDGLSEE